MDMNGFLNSLWASNNPVLPHPTVMWLALHGVWSIVLGCGALLLAGKLARPYRLGFSGLVMVWALLPGSASPAYWLGLAFQTPSVTSAVLGLVWFVREIKTSIRTVADAPTRITASSPPDIVIRQSIFAVAGVVLGWVLLLDTLALLPVSVYAWGFSSAAVGAVAVLLTLLWALWGTTGANREASDGVGPALILSVLVLFVLTRLPTGNVWDALIDPWLWLGLQVYWLLSGLRCLRAKRRSPPAIPV